jgi:hypothetical protein
MPPQAPPYAPIDREAPIDIVDYDAAWPARFAEERALIERTIAPWLVEAVDHIGSIAVPGLVAKPIIDIMAPVRTLDAARPAIDMRVYFRDPRSPWQRGSNENTNGLLRQYLPKGIDISSYSQAKLNGLPRQLNERPRKTLGFQTPAEMFSQTVALTS